MLTACSALSNFFVPANARHWPNVVSILAHRLWHWPSITLTFGNHLLFAVVCCLTMCVWVVNCTPANMIHWPNVVSMLGQRRRRWPNIDATSNQLVLLTGYEVAGVQCDKFEPHIRTLHNHSCCILQCCCDYCTFVVIPVTLKCL